MALWEDLTLVTVVLGVVVVGGGAAALGSIRAATAHSLLDEIHYGVCEGGKLWFVKCCEVVECRVVDVMMRGGDLEQQHSSFLYFCLSRI
jgi:hypothetical protein